MKLVVEIAQGMEEKNTAGLSGYRIVWRYWIFLSQSRRPPPLQVVRNHKLVSVGVQSSTEINAPQGCAVIL